MKTGEDLDVPEMREVVVIPADEDIGRERKVLYQLQPQQNKAYCLTPLERGPNEHYPRHIGYGGAAGGGKSYLARAVATAACLKWPGINALILRRTKAEVQQNHVDKFRQEVPSQLPSGQRIYRYNGEQMCARFEGGSKLYFGFLKESSDRERYSGQEYDVVIPEESTHYAWEDIRWLVGNRMRATQPYSRPFALYPSNPGRKGHQWYKRLFIDRDYDPSMNEHPEDYAFVQAKVEHNYILRKRDPQYIAELETLPEPLRSWLRDGDWDAGVGIALPMMDKERHFVEPFEIPPDWTIFGSFDWGYSHPWSFGLYAVDPDDRVFKVCTLTGRYQQEHDIAESVKIGIRRHGFEPSDLQYIVADKIVFDVKEARTDSTKRIADTFAEHGLQLTRANQARIHGLNLLRRYLAWEGMAPDGSNAEPWLRFFDNDSNRSCFQQLASIPVDEDNPEDAAKQNADQFGHGGDDMYDETRYAIASRPPPPDSRFKDEYVDPWSQEALDYERQQNMTTRDPTRPDPREQKPEHPEFGRAY